jgi:1-acyl-sn-glycerol-3-phosphate acyltransferase
MRTVIATIKISLFLLQVVWIAPFQILMLLFTRGPAAYVLPQLWHSIVHRILGIRVLITGTPCTQQQTLFMSNHISYLDIPVLGSVIPASFVAKEEVAGWALFGFLSKLSQTVFIQRTRRGTGRARNELAAMIERKKTLIIFPEGTSSDGQNVYDFKSSLFILPLQASNPDLMVQPVTVRVEQTDGKPVTTQDDRDLYSWHVDMDMELGPHLWRFAKTKGSVIRLIFHTPLSAKDYTDRKTLCRDCYNAVSSGLLNGQVA